MTDLETLITKLRKASKTIGTFGRGDPDPQDEYKPAMTGGERDYLVFLLERERHVKAQKRVPIRCTDFKALSGDIDSDRVIKLHFRRPATEQDQEWLLEAINAKLAHPPAPFEPQAAPTIDDVPSRMEVTEMNEFKQYRRSQIAELRPITLRDIGDSGFNDAVSVSQEDRKAGSPKVGDMVARNPKNYNDMWLVAAKYFADNFEPI